MIKKILCLLLLGACTFQPKPHKNSEKKFIDTHILFDLNEETNRFQCPLEGKIPEWLSGILLRNGPAKFTVNDQRVDWFDGLAMLHAFEFNPNHVFYSNRFIRSAQYYIMMDEKSLNFSGFAQDPCSKRFKNQTSRFIPEAMRDIKNADVTIQDYADKMVALTEVPLPVIFDKKSLETLENFTYQDTIAQGQWESAHPQKDPTTGESVNYFIRFGKESSYVIWKMADHQSKREVIAEIPVDRPAYMHTFALTEHYVVLVEFPFVVNPVDLMQKRKPFIFNYKWEPKRGTNFIVVDRSSGAVTKIKGDPFFAFHHVNAFDKGDQLFLDIVTYKNAKVMDMVTSLEKLKDYEKTKLERFTIDLPNKKLSREVLLDKDVELPRVAPKKIGREYRYSYLVDYRFPSSMKDSRPLYKFDAKAKTELSWSQQGCFPGEPIFVARPGTTREDDGVIMSLVLDFAKNKSFLLILDAQDFKELGRAEAPHAIPVGLHGLWHEGVD